MTEAAIIQGIYRYPVKGLSAERLDRAALAPGETLAGDRRYAIENGPSGFDPAAPSYLPKQRFLMLMKDERLACLDTAFSDESHLLVIRENGREAARGDLRTLLRDSPLFREVWRETMHAHAHPHAELPQEAADAAAA